MDEVKLTVLTSAQSRSWQSPVPYPELPNNGLDSDGLRPSECILCTWYGNRVKFVSGACSVHGWDFERVTP